MNKRLERLLTDIHTARAWNIVTRIKPYELDLKRMLELSVIIDGLRTLVDTIEIAGVTFLMKHSSFRRSFVEQLHAKGFLKPKIYLEWYAHIKSMPIHFTSEVENVKDDDFTIRFLFPLPVEVFWSHTNAPIHTRARDAYPFPFGDLYYFLRNDIFWPSIEEQHIIWYIRISKKKRHEPNKYNYVFKVSAPNVL